MLRATLLVAVVGISLASAQEQKAGGKAFSLFNVVTFKNDDCVSTSNSPNAGTLNGRCYTSQGMIFSTCIILLNSKYI